MFKKVWSFIKGMFWQEEQIQVVVEEKKTEPRSLSYWSEYAEQLRIIEQAKIYRSRPAKTYTKEEFKAWQENNLAVDAFFKKQQNQTI